MIMANGITRAVKAVYDCQRNDEQHDELQGLLNELQLIFIAPTALCI